MYEAGQTRSTCCKWEDTVTGVCSVLQHFTSDPRKGEIHFPMFGGGWFYQDVQIRKKRKAWDAIARSLKCGVEQISFNQVEDMAQVRFS